jgi:hypothetical protein
LTSVGPILRTLLELLGAILSEIPSESPLSPSAPVKIQ